MSSRKDTRRAEEIELRVTEPCEKSWDELVGGDRERFCGACRLHVFNSEALTRREAQELTEDSSERVCMRVVREPDGSPRFADSGPARVAGWALAAGSGLLAACGSAPEKAAPTEGPTPPPVEQPTPQQDPEVPPLADPPPAEWMGEVEMGAVVLPEAPEHQEPDPQELEPRHEILGRISCEFPPEPAPPEPEHRER